MYYIQYLDGIAASIRYSAEVEDWFPQFDLPSRHAILGSLDGEYDGEYVEISRLLVDSRHRGTEILDILVGDSAEQLLEELDCRQWFAVCKPRLAVLYSRRFGARILSHHTLSHGSASSQRYAVVQGHILELVERSQQRRRVTPRRTVSPAIA
ncbi:hypothetical protein [Frankia sp. AgB32]|uniref:hypothetical protein n=1 Tax=Frankia sp. AgB32 TaxID=631119 RepID=UPI00200E396C|nr:hypothetical protein [Frankia sp. AgB32]MCK9895092.1 hypothetical protein [Frankia sp. AgB32]